MDRGSTRSTSTSSAGAGSRGNEVAGTVSLKSSSEDCIWNINARIVEGHGLAGCTGRRSTRAESDNSGDVSSVACPSQRCREVANSGSAREQGNEPTAGKVYCGSRRSTSISSLVLAQGAAGGQRATAAHSIPATYRHGLLLGGCKRLFVAVTARGAPSVTTTGPNLRKARVPPVVVIHSGMIMLNEQGSRRPVDVRANMYSMVYSHRGSNTMTRGKLLSRHVGTSSRRSVPPRWLRRRKPQD